MTDAQDKIADECLEFAQATWRRGMMKGLDPKTAMLALMTVAMEKHFGISTVRAVEMVKYLNAYALELVNAQVIEGYAKQGMSESELADLNKIAEEGQAALEAALGVCVARPLADRARAMVSVIAALPASPNPKHFDLPPEWRKWTTPPNA